MPNNTDIDQRPGLALDRKRRKIGRRVARHRQHRLPALLAARERDLDHLRVLRGVDRPLLLLRNLADREAAVAGDLTLSGSINANARTSWTFDGIV